MKLGTLLSAALGAVSLLGSAVGCYVAVSKYSTMADVNEARTRLQVARIVGQIVPLVASERGYATNIIFAPTPAEMPSRAGLDKLRAITDAAHSRMLEGRRELIGGLSDATAIAQSIDALDAQFKLLRSDMDRAFVLSSDARKEAGQKVNRENVRLNKIASDLVNEQIRLLAPLHGYAYRLANFAGIAIALRGMGGNYSSFAKNYIALERPATIEQKLTFAGISAHSALLSASLMELRDVPGTPANVIAALDQFKASYVTRFGDVVKRVAAEAETGKYSIGLETFYGESQPALKTIVAVRDALYENAEAALAETYSKARTGFLLALAGLIFTLAISAAAMLVVVRGVSRPIMQLTQRMSSLAGGDLDRAIPHMGRADEVGEMAGALVVFRDAAREKTRLEHAAEEARIAAEQERLRTQAEAIRTERELVVRAFGAGMARLAEKDLSFRLEDQVPEAYATLQSNFNRAVDALEAALLSVAESSRTIAGGTGEISGAATDLARRTESQAASLEQTAAAIDEITNTGRKAAEGAAQARDVVRAAKTDAEKTGLVVRETVAAIGNIEKSSDQISRIISVIDEIAFQTNLLALNAGVEAARAGEAGRGFAVVASEVRGLAQRSAEAAKEIKGLVTASSAHVAHGVELVAATGKALERILVQVNDINEVVGTIASGAETQASGLGQINTAITQMDQNTQQNAAMVEETTAASCTLEQQARHLRDLISAFSLRGSPVLADAPRTRRRAA